MEILENLRILDGIDILLVAILMFYLYRLVKGTVAINIFIGIVVIYLIWQLTVLLKMEMLSTILGQFIGVGMFALIVVFQQEIRKFLLLIGSTNLTKGGLFKNFNFSKKEGTLALDLNAVLTACENMAASKTGALIIIRRDTSLEFVKDTGDRMEIEVNRPIIESVFYKNSTLHDGAMIIEENKITATRVILPVTQERDIPLRFGLRHRAAVGITEKTDALALVVSEESGAISYIKDGEFVLYKTIDDLRILLETELT
ncbi:MULTISPECIES: diadenylate cyclase [Dokdonia]|uniref:Diadenylate cyclase n=2 Tax=Dokdonia TaxID=326319 RepID=A0A0A2GYC2_9FLAO|nr:MULTISPECIES: diadenylate cyclase [Dokdonia]ANH61415.1 DNA integrity scanning protein DisA [Dokdonia donghaensis DSW-1]EAQ38316.2 DisA protein [Dokdonia sp. MED134]KGO05405.1 membrane protein [Dokdonia donghaensis DSW-1]